MALAVSNAPKTKNVKLRRRQYPSKRSINLAFYGEKKLNLLVAVPAILVILVLAALLSKFFVIDRLNEVTAAQREVGRLQTKLSEDYRELADYDDINEIYAHYTYSGMTEEELKRTDRVEILNLLHRVIGTKATVDSWSLTGNVMTVSLTSDDLQQVNLLAQALNAEEIVDFCSVSSAVNNNAVRTDAPADGQNTEEGAEEATVITARLIVYFKSEGETQE